MKKQNKKTVCILTALPAALLIGFGLLFGSAKKENASFSDNSDFAFSDISTEDMQEAADSGKEPATVFVHVGGEVLCPGVYELEAGSLVADAALLAGGFTGDAYIDGINMAERVSDGMQILVPSKADMQSDKKTGDGRINLNTATAEELKSLPGIGQSKADAIIAYRNSHGAFQSTEEVMQVEGIKNGVYNKIKEYISVR